MSFIKDGRGCCNLNCLSAMRSKCNRAVPMGTGGAAIFVPLRNWCDMFSEKSKGVGSEL